MQFLSISNARYIEATNTFIDLDLLTDEGALLYTYHPDDPAPACQWIKTNIDLSAVAPFVPTLEQARKNKTAELLLIHNDLIADGLVTDALIEDIPFHAKIDDTSISMWQVASEYPLPVFPLIKDWNNVIYTDVSIQDVEVIANQVLGYRQSLWVQMNLLLKAVVNAEKVEDVQAVTWDMEV